VAFLENSWRRFSRAQAHREAFLKEWGSLLGPDSYRVTVEQNTDSTYSLYLHLQHPIDSQIPLLLGEFFYQLRAALDGAAFESAILQNPSLKEGSVEFIIAPSQRDFEAKRKKIAALALQVQLFIELIQPYSEANTADTAFPELNKSLAILHECARIDRHRRLHVVGAVAKMDAVSITPPAGILRTESMLANAFASKSELARIDVDHGAVPIGGFQLHGETAIDFAIKEIPDVFGEDLDRVLKNILRAVDFVLTWFDQNGR
jgi:hypothetical protein